MSQPLQDLHMALGVARKIYTLEHGWLSPSIVLELKTLWRRDIFRAKHRY